MEPTKSVEAMASLIELPHEVLHSILRGVEPDDLGRLSSSCQTLHRFIGGNRQLFKEIYLQRLDEPPKGKKCDEYNWEEELHKLVKLDRILNRHATSEKTPHILFTSTFVTDLLRTATPDGPSLNLDMLSILFDRVKNQEAFLCQSTIFSRAKVIDGPPAASTLEERQASAKLHTLYGVPIESPSRSRYKSTYAYACSVVYDIRNYTDGSMWGPFQDDGRATIDWEKMEAVMIVLGHNLRMFSNQTNGIFKPIWAEPFGGVVPDSYTPISLLKLEQPAPPMDARDPYNVSGTWMRVVCFLDFTELFAYNFATPQPAQNEPRPALETTEAIRLIVMEVHTTKIEAPGEDDGQELPVVHFRGTSRSMHASWDPNANSRIRGSVRLTKEGEIRWTTFSIYGNEERWKSEGIQVGGAKSGRGVLGHWFDRDFDIHGPVGPTAFWKVSNEIGEAVEDSDDEYDEDFVWVS